MRAGSTCSRSQRGRVVRVVVVRVAVVSDQGTTRVHHEDRMVVVVVGLVLALLNLGNSSRHVQKSFSLVVSTETRELDQQQRLSLHVSC